MQQHGAGGAQVGVERVVPLLLALELLGRDVGGRRGLARFGRQLLEPLGGGGEPRRELRDRPLKGDAERVVPGLEGLQVGVGEVLVPQRRFGRGEGRARLVEIERMAVLRPGAPGPQEDEGENGPENGPRTAQCNWRKAEAGFIAGKMAPRLIRRRAPSSIRPWPGRRGNLPPPPSFGRSPPPR